MCNKQKAEDAGDQADRSGRLSVIIADHMDTGRERMNQLVSVLTAEWDRIERESGIQCQAGGSVDRNAELVALANKHIEEACNVLSAVRMSPGPINQLPPECFAHIMSFIPIQHVFVCMSVNKEWEAAARLTVRKHKSVQLIETKSSFLNKMRFRNPMNFILVSKRTENAQKVRLCVKSLQLMERLERLNTSGWLISGSSADRDDAQVRVLLQ